MAQLLGEHENSMAVLGFVLMAEEADAAFIIDQAERLVKVAAMCSISFGLADGVNDRLKSLNESGIADDDALQGMAGFLDASLMMAALRANLLLDSGGKSPDAVVSFQTIYHRLKLEPVQAALKKAELADTVIPKP